MITFTCPSCGETLDADDVYAGMTVSCGACMAPVSVPVGRARPKHPTSAKLNRIARQLDGAGKGLSDMGGAMAGCGCLVLVVILLILFLMGL